MTISENRMGQLRYTEFRTLPNWILGIDCHQHKKLNGIALLILSHVWDDKLPNIVSVTRQLMTLFVCQDSWVKP